MFVKSKAWLAKVGTATLLTTMMVGEVTAAAWSARSWDPTPGTLTPLRVRPTWDMWYGEPGMLAAPRPGPQSSCAAMCPPQTSTGFATGLGTEAVRAVVKLMERVWTVFPVKA